MSTMADFGSQGVANILHIIAKKRHRPTNQEFLARMDARVEAVARECNSQDVANTLWAYATMGRRPGERVLGALEAGLLAASGPDFSSEARCQLHQFFLSWSLEEKPSASSMQQAREAFESECRLAFVVPDVSPSASQLQVSHAVRLHLGLLVEDEYRCPRSGYAIDMLVSDARPSAASAGAPGGGRSWAVEFDGPDHFLACGSPKGSTLLKHRHLRQLGYALVVVPYWEWGKVSGDEASEAGYLRGKLGLGSV